LTRFQRIAFRALRGVVYHCKGSRRQRVSFCAASFICPNLGRQESTADDAQLGALKRDIVRKARDPRGDGYFGMEERRAARTWCRPRARAANDRSSRPRRSARRSGVGPRWLPFSALLNVPWRITLPCCARGCQGVIHGARVSDN
jgi:hypothetical protein